MFFDGRPAGLGLVSSALSCSLVSIFTDKLFLAVRNKVFYSSIAAVLGAAWAGAAQAGVIKLALGSVGPRTWMRGVLYGQWLTDGISLGLVKRTVR